MESTMQLWNQFRPSISLLIITFFIYCFLCVYIHNFDFKNLLLLILSWPLLIYLSYFLFPKIVVTIKNKKNHNHQNAIICIKIWADGKLINKFKTHSFPFQFAFQVWRRGVYKLCIQQEYNNSKYIIECDPEIAEANTYEHSVSHVEFTLLEMINQNEETT